MYLGMYMYMDLDFTVCVFDKGSVLLFGYCRVIFVVLSNSLCYVLIIFF